MSRSGRPHPTARWIPAALLAMALLAPGLLDAASALAHDYRLGRIAIGHIWARPAAADAPGAGVFGPLLNRGETADRLIRATTPIAERVRFRVEADGEVRWLDTIPVPAGRPTTLAAWRHHIWLTGLTKPLVKGRSFPLTLTFESAGEITVEVVVETTRGH